MSRGHSSPSGLRRTSVVNTLADGSEADDSRLFASLCSPPKRPSRQRSHPISTMLRHDDECPR